VIVYPKDYYPEKIDQGQPWRTNSQGKDAYNVFRSENSVKEAMIDLYLLSKTDFQIKISGSSGSFSRVASYLATTNNESTFLFKNMFHWIKNWLYALKK